VYQSYGFAHTAWLCKPTQTFGKVARDACANIPEIPSATFLDAA
jgi:hypothetical protein